MPFRARRTWTLILMMLVWLASLPRAHGGESPFLYGIHDHDTNINEYLDRLEAAGVTGWVTATIAIGSDPSNTGGDDFSWIADRGHTLIVRLNNGYCGSGTIPTPDRYDAFAQRAANYVAATRGADHFVIGNETNLAVEWPPVNGHARYVSPQDYAAVFRKTYDAIKNVRPDAKVLSQALAPFAGPYNAGSTCGYTHDANPLNWVQYLNQMLTAIKSTGGIDGIALHINSRGYRYQDIHSTQRVVAGGESLSFSFYVYKDWVNLGIPKDLYHLPLYATEANGVYFWSGGHPGNPDSHYEPGWTQEIYAEIDRYNQEAAASGKPVYRAVNLYRWCAWCDGWNIDGSPYKGQILSDVDQATAARYRWPEPGTSPPPPPPPTPPGDNVARGAINWFASSVYSSDTGGAKAYDGIVAAGSKWTSDGSSPESWLALDLGARYDVTGFIVRHAGAGGEPAYFNTASYRLESGDSLTGPWTTLATVSNQTQANETTTTLANEVSTRFVRLYITDAGIDNYARIPELEVYGEPSGTPAPPGPPPGDNLATGAVDWRASTIFNAASSGDRAYDGVISDGSKWTSNGSSPESWLALDLGLDADVTGFIVQHAGAGGEPAYFNTKAFRVESGSSLDGPWTTLATVSNAAQENASTVVLPAAETTRFVRLYVTDAGIDDYARIPELEVYGTASAPPPPPPPSGGNLLTNGGFASGLNGWSVWTERGNVAATIENGRLRLGSPDHNGGVYQQFSTGGAGTTISVSGLWESHPTAANNQWAEVLVINGARLPADGQDVTGGDADVVLLYKNDTWASPGGWSGSMASTAAAGDGSFVAAGNVATLILKSGNVGGTHTGTRYDDIVVQAAGGTPSNANPEAVAAASPTSGTAPLSVSFDGSGSSDPDGDTLTYSWSFGDGDTATGASSSHTYQTAGTFTATLTVDDGRGGSDADSIVVSVGAGSPPGDGQQWVVEEERSCNGPCDFDQIEAQLEAEGKDLGFVKIGFHVSPTGNQQGLGDWERALHDAGVPFFLKSVDSAGQILEAVQLKAASGCIDNSRDGGAPGCVPHRLVYRRSVTGSDDRPDVPYTGSPDCSNPPPADTPYQEIYNETPYEAALAHWERHRNEFPPELEPYKHLIWIETINEINRGGTCDFDGDGIGGEPFPHNEGLSDPVFGPYTKEGEWIAEFAIHTANLAMAEGFNWAAFGWSSGEPEIGSWAGPKMREFLELAAANSHRVGVALHEYSYTTDGLELSHPSLIGRYQQLFDVTDHYGIGRPTIVITEFGWTLNDIPDVDQAMNVDLAWASELYAPHHEIEGAAIWYLGSGWGGIDHEVQRLIAPMADYARSHYFVLAPTGNLPPPPPTPDVIGEVGSITTNQATSGTWSAVTFENQYQSPVVIAGPASFNGGQPTTLRLRNVTGAGFELQIDEWDYLDGAHATETIGYLVVEAGTHLLPGGARIEAGTVDAAHGFVPVSLGQSFGSSPVVLSQCQTRNGGQAVVTRQRNVTPSGFELRLQEEEANDGLHAVETVGYVAFEPGVFSDDRTLTAGLTPDAATHGWFPIGFGGSYPSPILLAGMQTQDGGDAAGLRYRNLGPSSVKVKIEEETSKDSETAHTTEVVGYVVFAGAGPLTAEP